MRFSRICPLRREPACNLAFMSASMATPICVGDAHDRILAAVPLGLFIDNAFVEPVLGGKMQVVDPADETVITADVAAATTEDVDLAVAAATRAFAVWSKTTGS